MNYTISEHVLNEFNASSKAREDVSAIVLKCGFVEIGDNDKRSFRHSRLMKILIALRLLFTLFFYLGSKDVLFVQTGGIFLNYVLKIRKIKKFKIIFLIHDMYSLAVTDEKKIEANRRVFCKEINRLNQCSVIIAHNERMKERLINRGCKSEIVCLTVFDYLTDVEANSREISKDRPVELAFAGHLGKSPFLYDLDKQNHKDLIVNVYGTKPSKEYQNLKYMGRCLPVELPREIKGNFGLIWEGQYEANNHHDYLVINNPHKLSMYIVSELPIIAWEKSYAGSFVESYGIGITISSLDELYSVIKQVDEFTYKTMLINIKKLSSQLRKGENLHRVLLQSLEMLN